MTKLKLNNMPQKDLLKTGSVGLVKSNPSGHHYLQVIIGDEDNDIPPRHYIVKIPAFHAKAISMHCDIIITPVEDVGDYGSLIGG